MNKIYLSRQMTRAMALDHPIGDPTGGPAYGERREPISAIATIAGGIGAWGAATSTLGYVLAGATIAGGALSLVGQVSGNAKLAKIGGVLGLAGGLGMGVDALAGGGNFSWSGGGAAEAASSGSGLTAPTTGAQAPGNIAADAVTSPVSRFELMDSPVAGMREGLRAPSNINAPSINHPGGAGLQATPAASNALYNGPTQNLWDKTKALGKDAMAFAKDNPAMAQVMGNAVSGAAEWLSGKTDAELDYMKAQTGAIGARGDQIRFEIEKEKQRRANLNAGYSQVNQNIRVNPNAQIPMPWQQQQPGLIQGVMAPRPA